ncbi:hypothetical protein TRIATDRAFT_287239 [Trichoderma atroviride IMI 206040]|uniref:Uncharacterized protein n=1 Tax=Hypocrea atroviridis (strain ATCC 20476 / IMI 206040) TaxID=452589 RepID=G9P8U2_HYPAI|nr:uncharacterized protein TRIATDRAFT_287239 [Trichoderma atroviride IMI 206040]EHK41814.1 hypothetical protein TRIATDRAFT_287239 [Trichoderma atroviride IMI 206040]
MDKSCTMIRSGIIQKLQKFSARRLKNEIAEVAQTCNTQTARGPPHVTQELDDDIQLLYSTLQQYQSCNTGGSERDIMINIRLNGYRALGKNSDPASFIVDNASAEFGVLFLDHPHVGNGYWQETCVQICHTRPPELPRVKFTDLGPNPAATQAQYEPIACESFCQQISCRNQDLIYLSTRDGGLVYHKRSDVNRDWLASCEAVSLANAFTKPELKLNDKSKAILGMLLAKTTWEFYDSAVIGQGLTSDNIHFICEQRANIAGAFVNEPVLLTRFSQSNGQMSDTGIQIGGNVSSATMNLIHDMPKILALGIILLEIETGKIMRRHRENPRVCPPGLFNINTDYKIACNLVATGPNAHTESIIPDLNKLSPLRTILPLCIKPGELRTKLQQTLSAQKKNIAGINYRNALRSVIYNEIAFPLQTWANQFDDLNRVKPLWEVKVKQEIPRPTIPLTAPPLRPRQASSFDNRDYRRLREGSRRWFNRYEQLNDYLQPRDSEMRDGYKRIKVAMLDTGITQEDYDYLRDSLSSFEYKDFVDEAAKDTACDNSGHGSAGVSLLLKTCPQASLYIARVLETDVALTADVNTVVQGINWAIERQVDIITMALGFEKKQQRVIDAIDRAYRSGILIFAAASNDRNFSPVYCPAILTDQVFAMYSTNAGIRESWSLNPSPIAGDSFAIFGENVELKEEGPLVQGTSYSTSIAAGLAAMLLDFVSQEADIHKMRELSNLKKKQGMNMIFREMAKSDNGYLCIRPWKLLKNDIDYEDHLEDDQVRKQEREWIRGTIVRLLQLEKLHDSYRG